MTASNAITPRPAPVLEPRQAPAAKAKAADVIVRTWVGIESYEGKRPLLPDAPANDSLAQLTRGLVSSKSTGLSAGLMVQAPARKGKDRLTLTVEGLLTGMIQPAYGRGMPSLAMQGRGLKDQMTAAQDAATAQMQALKNSTALSTITRLLGAATTGQKPSDEDFAAGLAALQQTADDLRQLDTALGDASRLFGQLNGLISDIDPRSKSMQVDVKSHGFVGLGAAYRTNLGTGLNRFSINVAVRAVQPLPPTDQITTKLAPLGTTPESALLAVHGELRINKDPAATAAALAALRGDIDALRTVTQAAAARMQDLATNPGAAAAEPAGIASELGALTTRLQAQGDALAARAASLKGALSLDLGGDVQFAQATRTAPGIGLQQVELAYTRMLTATLSLSIAAYGDDLAGFLWGEERRLRLSPDGTLAETSRSHGNVYDAIFERRVGGRLKLTWENGAAAFDARSDGRLVGGINQRLGTRVGVQAGVLRDSGTKPFAGLAVDLGRATIDLQGAKAIDSDGFALSLGLQGRF